MKNQGISLISLIITIIVIIILAAIVIFSGMDTPERAQASNYFSQISNVDSAIKDQMTGVSQDFISNGETRNAEQIYFKIATGLDCGQFGAMCVDESSDDWAKVSAKSGDNYGTANDKNCQRIDDTKASTTLKFALPKVRESDKAWYVTENGQVFNATGFVSGGKTYFTANLYADGETVLSADNRDSHFPKLAEKIATAIVNGVTGVVDVAGTEVTLK